MNCTRVLLWNNVSSMLSETIHSKMMIFFIDKSPNIFLGLREMLLVFLVDHLSIKTDTRRRIPPSASYVVQWAVQQNVRLYIIIVRLVLVSATKWIALCLQQKVTQVNFLNVFKSIWRNCQTWLQQNDELKLFSYILAFFSMTDYDRYLLGTIRSDL